MFIFFNEIGEPVLDNSFWGVPEFYHLRKTYGEEEVMALIWLNAYRSPYFRQRYPERVGNLLADLPLRWRKRKIDKSVLVAPTFLAAEEKFKALQYDPDYETLLSLEVQERNIIKALRDLETGKIQRTGAKKTAGKKGGDAEEDDKGGLGQQQIAETFKAQGAAIKELMNAKRTITEEADKLRKKLWTYKASAGAGGDAHQARARDTEWAI